MKKNRYIPFGYTMKNGRLSIDKGEAAIIRDIYDQYIKGSSLKEIADKLTREKVPYSEKMTDWGKARVARIIENKKYLGDEMHDKIIDDSMYYEAAAVKASRLTAVPGNLNAEIAIIKPHVRCIRCGFPMMRKSNKRFKTKTEWTCINPECDCKAGISDETLLELIMTILKRIHDNERLLDTPVKKSIPVPSALKQQLDNELKKDDIDQEKVLQIIIQMASEQYDQIRSTTVHQTEEIKRKIRRIEIRNAFSPELFEAITAIIRLGDGNLVLITKNDIEIGERYGNNKNPEEDSNADNS